MFEIKLVHFYRDFFRVRTKKFGKLWSTNHEDLVLKSYPSKSTFSGDHISAPRLRPQIFTRARE